MIHRRFTVVAAVLLAPLRVTVAQSIIYVDHNAPGPVHDGSSWDGAFLYLQDALAVAAKGMTIRVADGTYKPDQGAGQTPGNRDATFQLVNGVTLKGGYAGYGADDPDANDPDLYETILSGDLNGDDAPVPCVEDLQDCFQHGRLCIDGACVIAQGNDENTHHVVTGSGTDTSAVLEGVTITAGNADWGAEERVGAGLYNVDGSPTLITCTLRGNWAGSRGGGMYNTGNPVLTDCTFFGNAAHLDGGGIYDLFGAPTLTRCTFSRNSAYFGASVYNDEGSPTLADCRFSGNVAGERGGGVFNSFGTVLLTNCTFSGNLSHTRGGALYHYGNTALVNCTLSANTAWTHGGGIYSGSDTLTLTSCILWGNVDAGSNLWGAQVFGGGGTVDANYICVQGWTEDFGGIGNIGDDPLLVDADGADDEAGTEDDNLHLSAGSPCIDAGYPGFIPVPGETDLDGHARVLCGRVDMGAYEFGLGDFDCDQAINLTDFGGWVACMTGPGGGPYISGCEAFDAEYDGDVDLADFAVLQSPLGP